MTSWWMNQLISKKDNVQIKLVSFPRDRGENKKCLKPPPRWIQYPKWWWKIVMNPYESNGRIRKKSPSTNPSYIWYQPESLYDTDTRWWVPGMAYCKWYCLHIFTLPSCCFLTLQLFLRSIWSPKKSTTTDCWPQRFFSWALWGNIYSRVFSSPWKVSPPSPAGR